MKKLLSLVLVAVLVASFTLSVVAGPPVNNKRCPYDRECYIDQGCEDGVCWYLKCCREQVFERGECFWTEYECVSLIP